MLLDYLLLNKLKPVYKRPKKQDFAFGYTTESPSSSINLAADRIGLNPDRLKACQGTMAILYAIYIINVAMKQIVALRFRNWSLAKKTKIQKSRQFEPSQWLLFGLVV